MLAASIQADNEQEAAMTVSSRRDSSSGCIDRVRFSIGICLYHHCVQNEHSVISRFSSEHRIIIELALYFILLYFILFKENDSLSRAEYSADGNKIRGHIRRLLCETKISPSQAVVKIYMDIYSAIAYNRSSSSSDLSVSAAIYEKQNTFSDPTKIGLVFETLPDCSRSFDNADKNAKALLYLLPKEAPVGVFAAGAGIGGTVCYLCPLL